MLPAPGGTRPASPALPPARSPFEDEPDQPRPGTAPPNPRGGQNPPQLPQGDPFELDNKPQAPATPAPGQPRPPGAGAANIGPELSAPAGTPPAIQGARTSQIESTDEAAGRDDDGPLLALPSVNLAPVNDPGVPFGTQPPPPTTDSATNANATTAASAPRRGFFSGFFSNLTTNWIRR